MHCKRREHRRWRVLFTSVTARDSGATAQLVGNDMAATLERATYENGNATACELQAAVSSVLDGYDINVIYGDELQQKPSYRPFHANNTPRSDPAIGAGGYVLRVV